MKTIKEHAIYIQFMINVFQSLSDELIRAACIRLISLPLWHCLSAGKLQLELERAPKMQRLWKALQKKDQSQQQGPNHERDFLPSMLRHFFKVLGSVKKEGEGTQSHETITIWTLLAYSPVVSQSTLLLPHIARDSSNFLLI
jgi:hypothetical protein